MSDIRIAYLQAVLSEASYADIGSAKKLDGTYDEEKLKTALKAEGFSPTQATDFVARWRVVEHQPEESSGFSATLFGGIGSPGVYVLAIRGTQDLADIDADISGITRLGYARDQVYSLYNYFVRLITPVTENVGQWQRSGSVTLPGGQIVNQYEYAHAAAEGLGAITDGDGQTDFGAVVDVAGHSLGGHLALAFSRLFPAWTHELYTYNAPGIRASDEVDAFFRSFGGDGHYPSNLGDIDHNFIGEAGHELIAGFNGLPVAARMVYIEDQGLPSIENPAGNHTITALVDSLAVHQLFDPFTAVGGMGQIGAILKASSSVDGKTLETTVNALGDLFDAGTPITSTDVREDLYRRIHAINEALYINPDVPAPVLKPAYRGLSLVLLTGKSATELEALAHTDIAYRYALMHGNPFAVLGPDYRAHNANHELDLYSEATGLGLSDAYLEDRAQYLVLKNVLYAEDVTEKATGFPATPVEFHDLATGDTPLRNFIPITGSLPHTRYVFGTSGTDDIAGSEQEDRLYGGGGDDTLAGGAQGDRLEGGPGRDTLLGDAGDDRLEGQAGADWLVGGSGSDTLLGGSGMDVLNGGTFTGEGLAVDDFTTDTLQGGGDYDLYYPGRGDIIEDLDGQGGLFYEGRLLTGGVQVPGAFNTYRDDLGTLYRLDADSATLSIDLGLGDPVTVRSFTDGTLGIRLDNVPPPIVIGGEGGDTLVLDEDGRTVDVHAGSVPDHPGLGRIVYSGVVRRIEGRGGSDLLKVNADLVGFAVYGNAQDLHVADDGANDQILFDQAALGEGAVLPVTDLRHGGYLYGQGGNDDIEGGRRADYLSGGDGGDVLAGLMRADILDGGAGDDILYGGAGADVLQGGSDNDVLHGDIRFAATVAYPDLGTWPGPVNGWVDRGIYQTNANQMAPPPAHPGDHYLLSEAAGAQAGDDQLYGGSGDDYLNGNGGDDLLMGGEGADLLEGEGGDDRLLGESGEDLLYGDVNPRTHARDSGVFASGPALFGGEWRYRTRLFPEGVLVAGDDRLDGGSGNDRLYGGGGDDTLLGGEGDDHLLGEAGSDFLQGGTGSDVLFGGMESDRYRIERDLTGSIPGVNLIHDSGGLDDTLEVAAGLTPEMLRIRTEGEDLVIEVENLYGNPGGGLYILHDWFRGDGIERVRFADGLTWSQTYLEGVTGRARRPGLPVRELQDGAIGSRGDDTLVGGNGTVVLYGLEGQDSLSGGTGNDFLSGGPGDDALSAGAGDDTLAGGPGEDRLEGGVGSDTYRYYRGDEGAIITDNAGVSDVLEFGPGILPGEILVGSGGEDLLLARMEEGLPTLDRLRVTGGFGNGDTLERIDFADGTSWDRATLEGRIHWRELQPGGQLNGDGADGLYTLSPLLPDGFSITLADAGGTDTLWLGDQRLSWNDFLHGYNTLRTHLGGPRREGDDIVLDLSIRPWLGGGGSTTGTLRLVGQARDEGVIDYLYSGDVTYASTAGAIAHPGRYVNTWNDGWSWQQLHGGSSAVREVLYSGTAGDDTLKAVKAVKTHLYGNDGNDTLIGNIRNDILDGGPGNDRLLGGRGSDTYLLEPDGNDTIFDDDRGASGFSGDTLRLPVGTGPASLTFQRQGNDLLVNGNRIERYFSFTPDAGGHETPFAIEYLDDGGWRERSFSLHLPEHLQGLGLSAEVSGTGGDDTLAGDGGVNHLLGNGGNDRLYGLEGDDFLEGGAGDDSLYGGGSLYRWWAQDGADRLEGGIGADSLYGGSGDDILDGGPGHDELWGGPGNDTLQLGSGRDSDTIHFARGDGVDHLVGGRFNTLVLEDIAWSGMPLIPFEITPVGGQYELRLLDAFGPTGDALVLDGRPGAVSINTIIWDDAQGRETWYQIPPPPIPQAGESLDGMPGTQALAGGPGNDTFRYHADATWSAPFIALDAGSGERVSLAGKGRSFDTFAGGGGEGDLLLGSEGDDALFLHDDYSPGGGAPRISGIEYIRMGAGDDLVDLTSPDYVYGDVELAGDGGDDVLWGSIGDDRLDGGEGDDHLSGGAGDDTLRGGPGSDRLAGGEGDDLYRFGVGDGRDTLFEQGGRDTLRLQGDLGPESLWLTRNGDDLELRLLDGRDDGLTLLDWYRGQGNQVEQFVLDDGSSLLAKEVDRLVQAMAAFAPPDPGSLALDPATAETLAPVIASGWLPPV